MNLTARRASRSRSVPLPIELLVAVAASAVATQVKVWAEGVLQPLGEKVFPPSPAEHQLRGADPSGHPDNMPPTVLVEEAAAAVGAGDLSDDTRDAASQAIHWVIGVGAGTAYALASRRVPAVGSGRGALFGAVLLAGTHGSVLPALGLQGSLTRLPRSWWVWEPGSHLVYGMTVDAAVRTGGSLAARLVGSAAR